MSSTKWCRPSLSVAAGEVRKSLEALRAAQRQLAEAEVRTSAAFAAFV
jgi:hypothetical protein